MWQDISDSREKYKAYLCSREWAEKRQGVIKRANGVCERCGLSKVEEVHHKSYERLYNESFDDLQGVCSACHRYLGGHSEFDPAGLGAFRSAPQNLDAEMALIASMLLMNDTIDEVTGLVTSQSFYGDMNRRIADVIFDLHRSGIGSVDTITVSEELSRRSQIDSSGLSYFKRILSVPASPTNAVEYAKIVRVKANLRAVIYELSRIVDRAYFSDDEQVLSEAESALFAISDQRAMTQIRTLDSCLMEMFEEVDRRLESEASVCGVASGFEDLDAHTNGFQRSELIVLAARPSMGKTALFCNFLRAGAPTLVFSLEQSRTELSERLIVAESHINSHRLRSGQLTETHHEQLVQASEVVGRLPVFIDDSGTRTVSEIRSLSRRVHRKHGLQLIIIDYLQLIQPEDVRVPREQQVATITRQLKCLAKELQVPVIAISQLNRGVEMREDKRPRLADLRESGAIEQDADMVMFLHRPDAYDPEDRPGEAEIIIAKHRNGPTGIVRLAWHKEFVRFDKYCPGMDNDFNL